MKRRTHSLEEPDAGAREVRRQIHPAWLVAASLLVFALGAGAMMKDDDPGSGPGLFLDCLEAEVLGVRGMPFLNGLPVVQQSLEIVGEQVKVVVATTARCSQVTPSSLPFEWQVTGPGGAVAVADDGTLRPHFRPLVAGAYEARITYCPQTCQNKHVASDIVDIPPQTASLAVIVADQMPVPPASQPLLTPTAKTPPTPQQAAAENAFHEERDRKCGFPGSLADTSTPQLVPVRPWASQADYRLLEGQVRKTDIAPKDNELNHYSHDIRINVELDPQHLLLKVEGNADMEVEWESNYLPGSMRAVAGDRVSAFGFHTYDCHHSPISTEIHPPVLTAVHRSRAVRIPDGWPAPDGEPLGSNIWVPGIVTDIWANVHAGEISSNCSDTGLHQEAVLVPGRFPIRYGACIRSPHPIRRSFSFNVYLPENPQQRVALAGLSAPPAPLHVRVEPGSGPAPSVVRMTDGDVTFLRVTVDLNEHTGQTYQRRIVAAWVQPSPENWGLERWKLGIPSMRVYEDHDFGTDGDWVFWAATNNRDQEWTRLLNGNSVGEGTYTFGGRPWETNSPHADRSLGPHLLLFNPPFSQYFPGSPLLDLTRSLQVHTSGYDKEFWDDAVGTVNAVVHPNVAALEVGDRSTRSQYSSTGDYKLTYFHERMGPIEGAKLTAAGRDLAAAYTLGSTGRCTSIRRALCVLLPESGVVKAWDPSQEPTRPGGPELDWFAHAIYKPQRPEPFSLTDMPLDQLERAVLATLDRDPARAQRFFDELREEFDEVRGTDMQSEYARALPAFEAHLPAEQWQLHFGDIDPTPVDLAVTRISMSPPGAAAGQHVVFAEEIANHGVGAAAPFMARMEIDGSALGMQPVPALLPGTTTIIEFPAWTATRGAHRVRATADALARIAEPVEDNNSLERRIVVKNRPRGLPDLSALGVHLVPTLPCAGQPLTFVAQVENTGGNVLEAFVVGFGVDGAALGEVAVAGLAAGERVKVRSPGWTALPRRHTLRVTVDARGAVAESDETNNTLARTFRIRCHDPAEFQPTELAGCVHWYRADRGAHLVGNALASWENQGSAAAAAFSQSSASMRPTVAVDPQISVASIVFDGIDDFLESNLSADAWKLLHNGHGTDGVTVFVVFQSAAAVQNQVLLQTSRNSSVARTGASYRYRTNPPQAGLIAFEVNDGFSQTRVVEANTGFASVPLGKLHSLATRFKSGQFDLHIDLVQTLAGPAAGSAFGAPFGTARISSQSGPGSPAQFIDGRFFELIVYDRFLDDSELATVHGYLKARYKIGS